MAQGGSPGWAPPFLFSNPTSGLRLCPPGLRPFQTCGIFPMSRCGGGETDHCMVNRPLLAPGREIPRERTVEASAFFRCHFSCCHDRVCAQSLANDPGEWRLLSRVQVNPPGVRAFVETFFSHNQLKADPDGDLVLGFAAVPQNRTDTDVFLSRFVRSEDRWNPPVPFAGSNDLERSAAIWIDRHSGAVHVAWVGNKRQKSRGTRSELRLGYRRSLDGRSHLDSATAFPRRDGACAAAAVDGGRTRQPVSVHFQWLSRESRNGSICFKAATGAGLGARWTSISPKIRNGGTRQCPNWPSDRAGVPAWSGSTRLPDAGRSCSA